MSETTVATGESTRQSGAERSARRAPPGCESAVLTPPKFPRRLVGPGRRAITA